jgi:hypothetical protein
MSYQPPRPTDVPEIGAVSGTGPPLLRICKTVRALLFKLFRVEPADYSEADPGSREQDLSRP